MTEEQLEARLAPLREKLFRVRAKRPRPFLDTKVLTAWNGQMIAGLAAAGQALGEKKPIESAVRAADFVLQTLRTKDGRLLRTYGAAPGQKAEARLNGYLDDYAFLVHGLLGLHDATGEKRWLDEAKTLTDIMVRVSRRQGARRLLLHVQRSRKAVRPQQGAVRRRPAGQQQRRRAQPGPPVDEDRRGALRRMGGEDLQGAGRPAEDQSGQSDRPGRRAGDVPRSQGGEEEVRLASGGRKPPVTPNRGLTPPAR